jgi:hypothetical protein
VVPGLGSLVSGFKGVDGRGVRDELSRVVLRLIRESNGRTYNICSARRRLALLFFLPSVISFSARRCASLAFGHVVVMLSWVMRDVTRLRRRACLWEEERFR